MHDLIMSSFFPVKLHLKPKKKIPLLYQMVQCNDFSNKIDGTEISNKTSKVIIILLFLLFVFSILNTGIHYKSGNVTNQVIFSNKKLLILKQ